MIHAQPQSFDLSIGAVAITVPDDRMAVPFALFPTLLFANSLSMCGYDRIARAEVERVAKWLRLPADQADSAGRSELPETERGRGDADLRRLDRLNARLTRKDLTDKQRQAAIDERTALERTPQVRADAEWRDRVIGETTALEEARGLSVERLKSGAVRVDRCPVLRLLRAGHLTAEQFDTAMDVRDLYDARSEGIGSQLGSTSAGGVHNNDAYVLGKLQRAKALQRLGNIERRIAVECRDEPACLAMLRAVVGERVSLSAYGDGRAFERNARALARALDTAKG